MSFLRKLFGGGGGSGEGGSSASMQEHKGYVITAAPVAEGGQHRVSGTISKEIAGETKTKRFDRADRLTSRDEAVEMSFQKGRLMIDQLGDRLFD